VRWTVVIPAKALPEAKSRLLPASSDDAAHRRLVEAIRADTISAAEAADGVARILIVADRAAGDGVLVQVQPGLNAALAEGAEFAAQSWPGDGVAALVGDLPALRPAELAEALASAAGYSRAYVADAAGTGTTLLTARPGTALHPLFGPGSAARHGDTAVALTGVGPGLRHDVDTAEDLTAAAEVGLGPATGTVLTGSTATIRST
jgi:2-phospho-L-lactate guanylyltransferase